MKKITIISFLLMMILTSCTKNNLFIPNISEVELEGKITKTNNTGTPDIPEMIDDNLLKTGAKIFVEITTQNDVTAVFELPKLNSDEQVSWVYEWLYVPKSGSGVKKSYDKTLKFHAESNSNILLSIQCKKSNGVKSKEILSSAKVVINKIKKTVYKEVN